MINFAVFLMQYRTVPLPTSASRSECWQTLLTTGIGSVNRKVDLDPGSDSTDVGALQSHQTGAKRLVLDQFESGLVDASTQSSGQPEPLAGHVH
jgi:hypothetical protein